MSAANTPVREPAVQDIPCQPVADVLARIGDKWTVMVIGYLSTGPKRYTQIAQFVEGISQRMLTLTLKGLEQDGLVTRTLHAAVPVRVDYELTDLGRSLLEPLKMLYSWAVEHRDAVLAARDVFAQRHLSTVEADVRRSSELTPAK